MKSPPGAQREHCRVIVLGSTGSIGTQALEVIEHLNRLQAEGRWGRRYTVVGLVCGSNDALLREQAVRFGVPNTGVGGPVSEWNDDPEEIAYERGDTAAGYHYNGPDAAEGMVRDIDCDLVVAAIAGSAGIRATMAAVERGRAIALANKETLVAAGELIVRTARQSGARLLPIDSEHSGLWQCLAMPEVGGRMSDVGGGAGAPWTPPVVLGAEVSRVVLTASGGPFRSWTREQLARATPEQALNHPTWRMGPKVTIDSATLMNKTLELIEAHWLFGLDAGQLEVMIHPQSIVHAMVEYADGSVLAQLGAPDMRTPIQYALTYPERAGGGGRRLNFAELRALDFEAPDVERFPALQLAQRVIREGGTAGAIVNAANEAAVQAFLHSAKGMPALTFPRIAELSAAALDRLGASPLRTLGDALDAEARGRKFVQQELGR